MVERVLAVVVVVVAVDCLSLLRLREDVQPLVELVVEVEVEVNAEPLHLSLIHQISMHAKSKEFVHR